MSLLAVGFGGAFWLDDKKSEISQPEEIVQTVQENPITYSLENETRELSDASVSQQDEVPKEIGEVPFTSQAPLGDWNPDQFQNGCEEASILMATLWAKGKEMPVAAKAQGEISVIGNESRKLFGHVIDTSAEDTQKMWVAYAPNIKTFFKKNPTAKDIKEEIRKGNIVITPASGRELGNRFYTAPGPITHMLVIYGFDEATGEFITNDPGTKNGKGYRYKEAVLLAALWNYPTASKHATPPPSGKRPTAMLVVEK